MMNRRRNRLKKTYEGRPLDAYVVREHLRHLRGGKKEWFRRNDVIDEICKHHESLGGHIEDGTNKRAVVKKALQYLRDVGQAELDGIGTNAYWRIYGEVQDEPDSGNSDNPRSSWNEVPLLHELGDGEQVVYVVFYERHKDATKADPTQFGSGSALGKYPCKVGMTRNGEDYLGRVGEQFPLTKTRHDPITIGLVYHCERAEFVEKWIHGRLGVQGRQYEAPVPGGKEWFLTDPDEVLGIVTELERSMDVDG